MTQIKKNFFVTLGIIVLIEGILIGAFYYLLQWQFLPLLEKFSSAQQEIYKAESSQTFYKSVVFPDLEEHKAFFGEIQNLFYRPQTDPEAFERAVIFFEQAGSRNNLKFKITQTPTQQSLVFGLQVTGSFGNIMKLVQEIENDRYLLEITKFTIDGGVDSENQNASLTILLQS